MKIAFVSDAIYPYNKGGKEKRIYEISTCLAKRGHKYEIYVDITKGKKRMIDKNSVLIKNNEYKTITEDFTITVPTQRVKAVINLINKNQQIHFWMKEE